MFPVGLVTSVGVSSPIVVNGTITGFYDGWIAGRKYPVDMAGFAVNVKFFLERPKAKMPYTPGYEEDGFLKSLHPFDLKDIQIFANNCTEVSQELNQFSIISPMQLKPSRSWFGTHKPRRMHKRPSWITRNTTAQI